MTGYLGSLDYLSQSNDNVN